jgi:signal transduction histidine kinase
MSRLEELNTETNSLMKTLEKKRVFVKAVAHEIRTPLNVVLSGLNLLQLDQHSSNDTCY